MGLVVNIEHWPMAAAIALATEGVRASYNHGGGFGGGFGATDREIGSKLDGAKVLAVIECIGKKFKHLEDWMLFAYASPGWNDTRNRERFLTTALNDWAFAWLAKGVVVQERTGSKFRVILPLIASAFALEQASGAKVDNVNGDIYYSSAVKRESLISMLVDDDCILKGEYSDAFKKKRKRYYQANWSRWQEHIEIARTILINYDKYAQKLFKEELENKMMSNYTMNS
ncbi:hypothetical protein [Vibrio porteresiae]|uniref:Uncharacterized protein n=1 Tax=Vibrio porteresiae DSM 19223 TaxID=1123496 RepID=A0ABZ0Q965_9VIBR|nr:hypothetical protein [Vibrio porteresiae]WPC72940.1 hypothetical protein R8Z52_12475 [Vibrio porteresiae DSM 19223]